MFYEKIFERIFFLLVMRTNIYDSSQRKSLSLIETGLDTQRLFLLRLHRKYYRLAFQWSENILSNIILTREYFLSENFYKLLYISSYCLAVFLRSKWSLTKRRAFSPKRVRSSSFCFNKANDSISFSPESLGMVTQMSSFANS